MSFLSPEYKYCQTYVKMIKTVCILQIIHSMQKHMTPWRNGSASDSRSEGCVFESRRGQIILLHLFLKLILCIYTVRQTSTKTHQFMFAKLSHILDIISRVSIRQQMVCLFMLGTSSGCRPGLGTWFSSIHVFVSVLSNQGPVSSTIITCFVYTHHVTISYHVRSQLDPLFQVL